MKKTLLRFLTLLALPIALGLASCTFDSIDNPVVTPEVPSDEPIDEPTAVTGGDWALDENIDPSVNPGDNFFMHAIGHWWQTAEVDPIMGYTSLLTEQSELVSKAMGNLEDEGLARIGAHAMNPTANAVADEATLTVATDMLAEATTREDLWRAMGRLSLQGYQMPFTLISFSKDGRMGFVFVPTDGCDFISESDDDDDWSWEDMLRRGHLDRLIQSIRPAATTRGFNAEEWPMLVAVCEGMGVSPDDAYVINEDFEEMIEDLGGLDYIGDIDDLKELQDMDTDELREELTNIVEQDRLLFDSEAQAAANELLPEPLDMGKVLESISQRYLLYYTNHAYASQYVTPEMKERGVEAVLQLKEAFRQRIEANTWLSAASKQNAIEKMEAMTINVGYPEWRAEGLADLTQTRSFFEDVLAARSAYNRLMVSLAGESVAEGSFHSLIASFVGLWMVNACYIPNFNSMNIFPIWLQEPLYSDEAPDAYNYATYTVFGHEMTHGFDTIGAAFDKLGDKGSIWASAADEQAFAQRANQLANYYSRFEIAPGDYADGEKTLAENIADLGGTELALQALTNHLSEQGITADELRLQQRRFFYAYANLWRAKYDDLYARRAHISDEHSLAKERVNGVVSNIDLWFDLFKVCEGDALYQAPANRIHIW